MSELPESALTGMQGRNPTPPLEPVIEVPPGRSPIVAALLSLIPGLGHIYLKLVARGISYFGLVAMMLGLIYWTQTTHEFTVFPGLIPILFALTIFFWLWVIASAYVLAQGRNFIPLLGLLFVFLFTYILGWQVTEVNLEKFFTEFGDTYTIFSRVIWPWREGVAFERPEEAITIGTQWLEHCPEDGATDIPVQTVGTNAEPWVAIQEPACGEFARQVVENRTVRTEPGTEIIFYGGGFDPNEEVEVFWKTPIGDSFRPTFGGETVITTTDANGNFEVSFTAPTFSTPSTAVGAQLHDVQARQVTSVGEAQLSENVWLAINRMIVTIFQALMATSLGIVLAIPLSFLAARNLMGTNPFTMAVYYAVRFVMNVTRSIEPIIWAVIATVWVGLGPFAGVIALMVHTVASLAKLYSEAIESIDPGPIEAITATGATRLQTIMYAIIPQVIPPFLSFTVYRWDINVRMSTIIGFVGGGGIGQLLFQWIRQTDWGSAGIAVWLIAITVSLMDYASSELRKRFV